MARGRQWHFNDGTAANIMSSPKHSLYTLHLLICVWDAGFQIDLNPYNALSSMLKLQWMTILSLELELERRLWLRHTSGQRWLRGQTLAEPESPPESGRARVSARLWFQHRSQSSLWQRFCLQVSGPGPAGQLPSVGDGRQNQLVELLC